MADPVRLLWLLSVYTHQISFCRSRHHLRTAEHQERRFPNGLRNLSVLSLQVHTASTSNTETDAWETRVCSLERGGVSSLILTWSQPVSYLLFIKNLARYSLSNFLNIKPFWLKESVVLFFTEKTCIASIRLDLEFKRLHSQFVWLQIICQLF